jgi:hypothetical protein
VISEEWEGEIMANNVSGRDEAPVSPAFVTSFAALVYGLGCLALLLAFLIAVLAVLAMAVLREPAPVLGTVFTALWTVAAGLCAVGLASEASSWAIRRISLLGSSWAKWSIKLLGIPIAFVALADARLTINSITGGADPDQFTFILSVLTTLLTAWYVVQLWVPATLLLLAVASVVLFFRAARSDEGPILREAFSTLGGYLHQLRTGQSQLAYLQPSFGERLGNRVANVGRVAGVLGAALVLQYVAAARVPESVNDQIPKLVTTALVYSGYQPASVECSNYEEGEWVAPLGYDKASVAIRDEEYGYRFETRPCNSSGEPG